jgi:hypothetical protein
MVDACMMPPLADGNIYACFVPFRSRIMSYLYFICWSDPIRCALAFTRKRRLYMRDWCSVGATQHVQKLAAMTIPSSFPCQVEIDGEPAVDTEWVDSVANATWKRSKSW